MHLLDHASISVRDLDAARTFYDAVMAAIGCDKVYDRPGALGYGARCRADNPLETYLAVYFSERANTDEKRHWCFKAQTRAQVRAFHDAALANGGTSDGAPGIRPHYHASYYAAFVRDPSGNRLEAVCHVPEARPEDPRAEFYTDEGCFITELSNIPEDPDASIARARVPAGVTTRWHRLTGTTERYVILSGSGRVEVGELPARDVAPNDVVLVPPDSRQRITCTSAEDLVFLAICTPRFRPEAYQDVDPTPL